MKKKDTKYIVNLLWVKLEISYFKDICLQIHLQIASVQLKIKKL